MAEAKTNEGNTAVPSGGDRDRVAMLSLRRDGTPDQVQPEIIGDKDFALEATRRQFAEQAVSAVDSRERGVAAATGAETVGQDPEIARLQGEHQAAEKAAHVAAEKTVDALFTDDPELTAGAEPAGTRTAAKAGDKK